MFVSRVGWLPGLALVPAFAWQMCPYLQRSPKLWIPSAPLQEHFYFWICSRMFLNPNICSNWLFTSWKVFLFPICSDLSMLEWIVLVISKKFLIIRKKKFSINRTFFSEIKSELIFETDYKFSSTFVCSICHELCWYDN